MLDGGVGVQRRYAPTPRRQTIARSTCAIQVTQRLAQLSARGRRIQRGTHFYPTSIVLPLDKGAAIQYARIPFAAQQSRFSRRS